MLWKWLPPRSEEVDPNLSSDYEELYESKDGADCVLKVGETEFLVHLTLLKARSPVFADINYYGWPESESGRVSIQNVDTSTLSFALFCLYCRKIPDLTLDAAVNVFKVANKFDIPNLREACLILRFPEIACGTIEIKGVDANAVNDVLYYLYCGKIRGLTLDTAPSMFKVANMFALPKLREACLKLLLKNLTVRNICEVALLSHIHGNNSFVMEVATFMHHYADGIQESDEWQKFVKTHFEAAEKFVLAVMALDKGLNENYWLKILGQLCSGLFCLVAFNKFFDIW